MSRNVPRMINVFRKIVRLHAQFHISRRFRERFLVLDLIEFSSRLINYFDIFEKSAKRYYDPCRVIDMSSLYRQSCQQRFSIFLDVNERSTKSERNRGKRNKKVRSLDIRHYLCHYRFFERAAQSVDSINSAASAISALRFSRASRAFTA